MAAPHEDVSFWTWAIGIGIGLIGSAFGYTHKRIGSMRAETRDDIEGVRAGIETRLREGREDREKLWVELRTTQTETRTAHDRMMERMAKIPTREEQRADLAALENRLMQVFQATRH